MRVAVRTQHYIPEALTNCVNPPASYAKRPAGTAARPPASAGIPPSGLRPRSRGASALE